MRWTRPSPSVACALLLGVTAISSAAPPDAAIVCQSGERQPCVSDNGFWRDAPLNDQVNYLLGRMNDEELLGQLLAIGYLGTGFPDDLRDWITSRYLGSVKIFSRNVTGLSELSGAVANMQAAARSSRLQIPLLIITDQEGGWVRHIKGFTSETPGNLGLGASGIAHDAYRTGFFIGQELRALGINMNLAPTVDVYTHPEATVIGPRAFSSDPVQTALLSVAFFRGLGTAGVIATAKHFPGHGGAAGDSHGILPLVNIDQEVLWERELVPYRLLIREGLQAIMNAHVSYPRIIDKGVPASLSPVFNVELLRDQLGFEGVMISDDLEMRGVVSLTLDTPAAAVRAIEAGNDLVLVSHTPELQKKTWEMMLQHMLKTKFRNRVVDSARRVLSLKLRAFRAAAAVPLFPEAEIHTAIPAPGAAAFFFNSAARSVTAVRSAGIPFRPKSGERILLVGQSESFLQEGLLRFPDADTYQFPYSPFFSSRPSDREAVRMIADNYDAIIFLLMNYNSRNVLADLATHAKRVLVVSALTPVYLDDLPWVRTAVAVYGANRDSYRAGIGALVGDYVPTGQLPINFDSRLYQ